MRVQYPQLFNSSMNFEDEILFKGGGGGGGKSCNTQNYTLIVL